MPNIAADEVGYYDTALTASTTSTFTFARDCDMVQVVKDNNAADVFFTVNGTDPATAAGRRKGYKLPGGVLCDRIVQVPTSGNTVVQVWSTGTSVVDVAEWKP